MARQDQSSYLTVDEEQATADETARIYATSRWVGPAGCAAASSLLVLLLWQETPHPPLVAWLAVMLAIVVAMAASFLVPVFATRTGRFGLPKLSSLSHALVGAGFGSILWIDPFVRNDEVAMLTVVVVLFAVSAGVANGLSGLNMLGVRVIAPMWTIAVSALLVAGHYIVAMGAVVFVAIVGVDQRNSSRLWRELIVLRIRETQHADESNWKADHDELTGLLNRGGVLRQLRETLRLDGTVAALYIDLDHFKEVNDRFGHPAGDELLVKASGRLRAEVRDDDLVARIGGDEFFIVMGHPISEERLRDIGTAIIRSLEEPFDLEAGEAYISASIGSTTLVGGDADALRLITEADHAMYAAKRRGRRQLAGFTPVLEAERAQRSGLENRLRKAIRNNELTCAAQPVFDLVSGRIHCVELLARWTLPDGTLVPPSTFVPLAEEIGLVDELTTQMLEHAGGLASRWADVDLLADAQISVNVSPIQIAKGALFETVHSVVRRHGITRNRLILEVTESATLSDLESADELFQRLAGIGVELAIDDFGTGYSSLGHLMSLPVSMVKIDRSLSACLSTDPRQRAIMVAVRDLAGVLGQRVVAEGVEDRDQADSLVEMGITLGQGYGLCPPVASEELVDRLQTLAVALG